MSVNYGSIEKKFLYLSNEFAVELAIKWFKKTEDELEEIFGRYTKGKRKGLLRGALTWKKCSKAGWFHTIDGGGFMCPSTKVIFARKLILPVWPMDQQCKLQLDPESNCENSDLAVAANKYFEKVREFNQVKDKQCSED